MNQDPSIVCKSRVQLARLFHCRITGAEAGNFDNFGKISIKSIDFFHEVC